MSTRIVFAALTLAACAADPLPTPEREEVAEQLPVPDWVAGYDFAPAFQEALALVARTDTRRPWLGHRDTVTMGAPGCPDFYAGPPDTDIEGLGENDRGTSWADHCSTADGTSFGGYLYWESALSRTLEAGENVAEASRRMVGDGAVGNADAVLFELDGESSDALYSVAGDGYQHWTYSSLLQATVTGNRMFDGSDVALPSGLRADLYTYASGGDVDLFEARGNIFLFDGRVSALFDSVALDLSLAGPTGAGPDACLLEPVGWIGLRDAEAYWYDIVFQPRYADDLEGEDYENDPYQECDGCGTLYVRGIEDHEVCVDLSFLWTLANPPSPPAVEDYVLTVREQLGAP